MTNLEETLKQHIKKLVHPLKEGQELKMALKAKLTKKELKLLEAWADNADLDALKTKLKLDEERYKALTDKLVKKLNQEKTKQAICQ